MNWQLQYPLILNHLFLFIALSVILYSIQRRRGRHRWQLPPGPRALPIIGNMLMMQKLTHRGLAELADHYGGLLHLRLGSLHAVAVSTPEMAKEVLHVQDLRFSNRPASAAVTYLTYGRADLAFAHYGPFWRQMRKLCVLKLFSRRRAESWASVRRETDATVRAIAKRSGDRVEVGDIFFKLSKNIIFSAAFGWHSHESEDELVAIIQEFSALFAALNIGDFIPWLSWLDLNGLNKRLRKARHSLDGFIEKIIDDHRENPNGLHSHETDMLDELLAFLGESDGRHVVVDNQSDDLCGQLRLTRENIKAIVMDIMFGGTETVASVIEWAMAELMRWPEEMKRVQSELMRWPEEMKHFQSELTGTVGLGCRVSESDLTNLPYLKCAVKETLRLHPPIPLLPHEAAADCRVAGFHIPAGARVMVNAWAIGRDASAWQDPGAFRPSRFFSGEGEAAGVDFLGSFFELVPFGAGRRSCPGMQFGVYEAELALAELLHCFTWELPGGMKPSELSMEDVSGMTAPRAVRLVAVPTWRLSRPLDASQ